MNDEEDDAGEPLIAYVYGDTPPDFAAISASGFAVVCLDSSAPWFTERTLAAAKANGLSPVAFRMSYAPPLAPTKYIGKRHAS
jgi:hypothetical protein